MAENSALEQDAASGSDYAQHTATYLSFVKLVKWSVVGSAIILILMAYFLV